ncbi:MAG: NAD(P)/FAD-dependent oxidoreductase [Pseudomonadales bacterium]
MSSQNRSKVVIIGSGFSGICLGIKLKEAGLNDFLILEKAEDVGGTWRENHYPGAACDIPSALYSYSFEHNSEWKYKWSKQAQIFEYQKSIANKYSLYQHTRFGQNVISASFDDTLQLWTVTTVSQEVFTAQHLVSAVGQLHCPSTPHFPDDNTFTGASFHAANWDHSVSLKGKRAAVIGSAASALQFIPEIAKELTHLTVFQRSPNWVIPKLDRPYKPWEQWLSDKFSFITKLYRLKIWLTGEYLLLPAMRKNRLVRAHIRRINQKMMKASIADTSLRKKLTPDYPVGSKRILFSNNYYDAIARDNVYLDTSGIEKFTPDGILRKDGIEEPFDVIIYGTGFKTNPFLEAIDIKGLHGKSLREAWSNGAEAYLGVSTHGFPNMHMMYGPNTNLAHNSIIIMIEAQSRYIVDCITGMDDRKLATIEVKKDSEKSYNEELQNRLRKMAFYEIEHSWYMDGGKVTNNWAGGTVEYKRRMRHFPWADYQAVE